MYIKLFQDIQKNPTHVGQRVDGWINLIELICQQGQQQDNYEIQMDLNERKNETK